MTREEKKITQARVAMLLDRPFFGHIAMQLEIVKREDMFPPTMGTDGYRLFYHPEFISQTSLEKLQGVVAHEVGHLVLLHLTRRQSREKLRWNLACVTGNTLIAMADGSYKPIKNIRSGENIIGYRNGKAVIGEVLLQFTKSSDKIVEVSTLSRKLTCTGEHQILTSLGFKEAGKIETGATEVVTLGTAVCNRQLPTANNKTNERTSQQNLPLSRGLLIKEAFNGEPVLCQTAVQAQPNRVKLGVSSRNYRWRGNGNYYQALLQTDAKTLPPSILICSQLFLSPKSFIGQLGILVGNRQEQSGLKVLEDSNQRVVYSPDTRKARTLSCSEETGSAASQRIYPTSDGSTVSCQSQREDARATPESQDFEQERVKIRRRNGKSQKVYDLITTCHSYIANGIVVHNCDFATNDLVLKDGFELPKGCLHNPNFADKTSEWIYNQIPEIPKITITLDSHDDWVGSNGGNGKDKDKEGEGQAEGKDKDKEGEGGKETGASLAEGLEQRIREMVAQSATAARMKGKFPAHLKELVDGVLQPKLDWKTILQDMIVSCAKSDFTMFPANKKHLYRGFYLPGITGTEINIACVIDTSGSISSQEMQEFLAEVKGICDAYEEYTIYLMTCDAAIHQRWEICPFDPLPRLLEGRGGTDFREPIKEAENLPITSLVYLTDLFGTFPDKEPFYPVIWVCTTDAIPPWGQVIRLPERK